MMSGGESATNYVDVGGATDAPIAFLPRSNVALTQFIIVDPQIRGKNPPVFE